MADIQFDEEEQGYAPPPRPERKSFLTQLMLATGIVSEDGQVQHVLLGAAAVFFVFALIIPLLFSGSKHVSQSVLDSLPPPVIRH
ncbi:hypothetical protein HY972_02085 [Candidatus Kaiserbacteria bacterium]|nr:hypothetical protein [Candidatus Kaiserbacteria bacterium]